MRLSYAVLLLATYTPLAFAIPKITIPATATTVTAGKPFTITWVDDGATPNLANLLTYQIFLYSGGDGAPSQLFNLVTNGAFSTGSSVQGLPIPATIGAAAPGKYFIGIRAVAKAGGTITTFSERFTITGMTGTFSAAVLAANAGVTGTAAPPAINQLASNTNPTTIAAPAAGAPATASGTTDPLGWTVPYNMQTGAIRYAPMQPIPGSAITATYTSPLWPTSSVVLAATFMPLPSEATTLTQPPLSNGAIVSHANTAAAASSPVDDMQRFLNRWKD